MQIKEIIPIKKIDRSSILVSVPGSKSITNRALLLATLADGTSTLRGALFSDDSRHFLKCVQELGFETRVDEPAGMICVTGLGGAIPKDEAEIYVGSAGTAARFLAAFLACSHGHFYMDASEQMKKRPMEPLLKALREVGAEITCIGEQEHFPLQILGKGICKLHITVDIDQSSQFLSALLISGCLSEKDLHLHIEGSHGMAYIKMTVEMMKQFGVSTKQISDREFVISRGQGYRARTYDIEPDASAACYFWAMAAILGISVTVEHTHFQSLQGDVAFVHILEQMGCRVQDTRDGIMVTGPMDRRLRGVTVDMHACSDQAITLAAIAPFAQEPVYITGISHIRMQESDRLSAIIENLGILGIRAENWRDGVVIYPGEAHGGVIQTHDDHRLAMGFALTGLRVEGVSIADPMCCRKTFEDYFSVLEQAVWQLQQ